MFRAEKAFPDDVVYTRRDKDAQSSLFRCKVLETRDDIAK